MADSAAASATTAWWCWHAQAMIQMAWSMAALRLNGRFCCSVRTRTAPIVPTGRNDDAVMRHDQGGQCDPFDPEHGLVLKGDYVTVQNEVSCGAHWSDYVTFRYDRARSELLFDSEIYHGWKFNPSDNPSAEALVPDGKLSVTRADPHHPVTFAAWNPPD